jgi:hypothetical protein
MGYAILACCVEENYLHNIRRAINDIKLNFEVQRLINIYKNKIKKNMYEFINKYLPYYYEPYRCKYSYKLYDSELDYEIRHFKPVDIFYFGRFPEWDKIRGHMYCNSHIFYDYHNCNPKLQNFDKLHIDMCNTINHIENVINLFSRIMNTDDGNDMVRNLSYLDKNKVNYRENLEYTLNNEIEEKKFKIFKKPVGDRIPAINPKPYYHMKEYIKEYVLRKKTELENVIEQI